MIQITKNENPAKGKLLISEPFLPDINFNRRVVLLCEHNEEGSFGLILNSPLDIRLSQITEIDSNTGVNLGGPVQTDTLHILQRIPALRTNSQEVLDTVYYGCDYDILKTFLLYLGIMPDMVWGINGKNIRSSDIPVDMNIAEILRDI